MPSEAPAPHPVEVGRPLEGRTGLLRGLEIALAVMAVCGAAALLTGAIPMEGAIRDVPYSSPVLAGVALGLANGLLPFAVVVADRRRQRWARAAHLAVGLALMGWIVVQVGFIGTVSWMQPAFFAYGAAIFGLGWLHWRATEV